MRAYRILLLVIFEFGAYFSPLLAQDEKSRDLWQKPESIMDSVGVRAGMVIGEAGAGEGYLTFKLAKRVGETGQIYANDIEEKVLKTIQRKAKERGVQNITTVLGEIENPLFPAGQLDMVIMILAFHDFTRPTEWLQNVVPSLKSGAPLVIIDRDPERWGHSASHFLTSPALLKRVAAADCFEHVKTMTFLPRDNIYIFRVKPPAE
jgi:ubiquinone/menaquinone biosynthesis C-methylase UbiE